MRLYWLLLGVLAAASCPASTIVSTKSTATLKNGDSLEYLFTGVNFSRYTGESAASSITIAFNTSLVDDDTVFAVSLQSLDGSLAISLGTSLSFHDSTMTSALYSGSISTLYVTYTFTEEEAAALFGASGTNQVLLVLSNMSDTVTVGLPNYTLMQAATISLGSGSVSAGATTYRVYLDSASGTLLSSISSQSPLVHNPEPASLGLGALGIGGVLLYRTRARRRRGGTP